MIYKKIKSLFRIVLRTLFPQLMVYQHDWGNLSKYKKQNQILGDQLSDYVVFMGDSITEQWSRFDAEFFTKNKYINRGISGQTTAQMLLRYRQDVIALEPQAVVLLAGTNDIAGNTGPVSVDEIFETIKSMVELAQVHAIQVVLCSVLPVDKYPWSVVRDPVQKIRTLNGLIKGYAQDNRIAYVDYYTVMKNKNCGLKKEYTTDGVHVTHQGYQVMQSLVSAAIKTID